MRKKWRRMRLPGPALVFSLLVSLTVARTAAADSGEIPTVVLGLEAVDGTPDNLAADITDALRQRVAATRDYQLLQGKDLVEVKLVFACPDEAPACMSQAGKSLGASKLIFGNVKKAGGDFQVTLKMLDVNRAVVESFETDTIPKRRADSSSLRQMAPVWLAKLSGKGNGTITVRANFPGAAVSLDGTKVGVSGGDPVVVADVAPGKHEVSVEKSGYTTTKQEFTLAAGQSLPLTLSLSPVSVEVPKPESAARIERHPSDTAEPVGDSDSSHTLARTGFWVAVVGTLTSASLALKFGLDVRDINSQLDQYRRFSCSTSPTGLCDSHGASAQQLSLADKNTVASKTDQGDRDQTLQWVFVGVGGAFAIAGGYLLYKGYLASEGSQSASNHGLRIFPTATASAGGIVAEFDF
jgi:PEGA domain